MSKVVNIKELKGDVTPKMLLQRLLEQVDDIDNIMVVVENTESVIKLMSSTQDPANISLYTDIAKDQMLDGLESNY